MQESRRTYTLEDLKLVCIQTDEFTDDEVWEFFVKNVILSSEEDIKEFCAILHKYRPAVEERYVAEMAGG